MTYFLATESRDQFAAFVRDLKMENGSNKSCFQVALANLQLSDACNSTISVNYITIDKFDVR